MSDLTDEQREALRRIVIKSALWGYDAAATGATREQAEASAGGVAETLLAYSPRP